MSNCTFDGFGPSCTFAIAGFRRLWVAARTRSKPVLTVVANGVVTYIDTTLQWKELPITDRGTLVENLVDGTYQQALSFDVAGITAVRQQYARLLAVGRFAFVVQDNRGQFWAVGFDGEGARRQVVTANVGQKGDENLYKASFLSGSVNPMRGIVSQAFAPDLEGECPSEDDQINYPGNNYGAMPLYMFGDCVIGTF